MFVAYFPESIMPSRLKDESQDIKGNKFIVSAVDVNKHDEEIRAIQKVLGIRRPRFPSTGFVGGPGGGGGGGGGGGDPDDDFGGGGGGGGAPPGCDISVSDINTALQNISTRLSEMRDDYMLMTSGIVAVTDPSTPSATGSIVFPTDWPITTLLSAIPDVSVDEEEDLPEMDSIVLADVSSLPDEGGFITIINDAVPIMFRSARKNLRANGFTSLATSSNPIYDQNDFELQESVARKQRIFGMGTNVEILEYAEMDRASNTLYNVGRRQMGTSSTRHHPNDLVFAGRVSVQLGPVNYRYRQTSTRKRIDALDCVLRSNGKVEFNVRKRDLGTPDLDDDRTTIAYVHYHALLLRELDPIPLFEPGNFGECQ